jgi:hypothetical protein
LEFQTLDLWQISWIDNHRHCQLGSQDSSQRLPETNNNHGHFYTKKIINIF